MNKIILIILLAAVAGLYILKKPLIPPGTARPETAAVPTGAAATGYRIEEYVSGLYVPWSIVFTEPDRMLVAERNGSIRIIQEGRLDPEPLHKFADVTEDGEAGLMGLATDPQYGVNRLIYAAYAYRSAAGVAVRIVLMKDDGDTVSGITEIVPGIAAARIHAGTGISFGPDGKLYISSGDGSVRQNAQNMSLLSGKILRLETEGSVPGDNPFAGSPVYALGFRNVQGLAWDRRTGNLWATDHGPSGFDGPGGGDEINLVKRGANYGWPVVSHEKTMPQFESPQQVYTPAVAPAGLIIYDSSMLPQLRGKLLFTGLRGEGIFAVELTEDRLKAVRTDKLPEVNYGRIRAIAVGPEGYIYFSTSNRDGRGKVRAGDDRIFRIIPNTGGGP
ncbi:hypothetical protein A2Z33_07330 [Candidatus Gottesmanbacteria bacterium RBG_16_52_11]|uniref:Glucose/Sorbosone dehydrogenase domain-containing protein n=1 Tax=Candidatus Gottesmanbacteria bacterium RBG_16_52_11 TaxID=1798374 RepID=A0A1F5YYB1_9BACT|nr:MAG: hypothetical protein A2Z33_07330 [Candidatus Gottesmanbacteria bacterium RBG_16_52_11]